MNRNLAIRTGLRFLEEREKRLGLLRQALQGGEGGGRSDYSLKNLSEELDNQG